MGLEEVPQSPTEPGMVGIAVAAAGVNFFDLLQIAGTYQVRAELPFIPGAEVAGTAQDVPLGSRFSPGDRVMARVSPSGLSRGGYAEFTQARPQDTVVIPDTMPFAEAAAFFINYQTSWFGLHRRAALQAGEVLLVHAGAGGVGSAAVQLGKAAGARVVATAGSAEKVETCRGLGADLAINYRAQDFAQAVREFTAGRGADVIYDPVGGDVFEASTKCIAFEGRILVVGFASGRIPELRASHVLVKNYSVVGLHWGLYSASRPELVDQCTEELFRLYREGRIRPLVSCRRPLDEAATALAAVAARQTVGKVVLLTSAGQAS